MAKLVSNSNIFRTICRYNQIHKRNNHELSSSEYTDVAKYPPILDISYKGKKIREREDWHEKIKTLPTVEQKLIELNMPKYYGFWAANINDEELPLACGDFLQYATRTYISEAYFPLEYYFDVEETAASYLDDVKEILQDVVLLNNKNVINRRENFNLSEKEQQSRSFIDLFNSQLLALLSSSAAHIQHSQVDSDPACSTFWTLGGFNWNDHEKKVYKKITEELDYSHRYIQTYTKPVLQMRTTDGLPQVIPAEQTEEFVPTIPICRNDPRTYHIFHKTKHARICPGFWTGSKKEHSHIMYYSRNLVNNMQNKYGETYEADMIIQRLMTLASFTKASSTATWLGFAPMTEMMYPIVQQSVVTDGKNMSLGLYQLNTTKLYHNYCSENPQTNVLWTSPEEPLYEVIEDGKLKGINEYLLIKLISMYLRKPQHRENATPYLAEYKHVSEFPASEEYRDRFYKYLLYLYGERPLARLKPEVQWWEYIYKCKFKAMHHLPKRKWFEGGVPFAPRDKKPSSRRLDEHKPWRIRKRYWVDGITRKNSILPRINSERLWRYDRRILKRQVMREHPDWLD